MGRVGPGRVAVRGADGVPKAGRAPFFTGCDPAFGYKIAMRRNVAILVFEDVEVLDFAGPFEVFAVADELRSHAEFSVATVAPAPGAVRAKNGLRVVPDFAIGDCPPPRILVVPGGFGTH